jgi:hypothetical protein
MGLALGLILKCKDHISNDRSSLTNEFNNASKSSISIAAFGALIVFVLFPFLSYDLDTFRGFDSYPRYNGPTSMIIGMAAAIVGSACVSGIINGCLIARDLIHAPIAGGIVVGSASYFLTAPVYALVAGFAGGASQTLIQNLIEKPYNRTKSVVSTISWSLFGMQGLLGGAFAAGYHNIYINNNNGITFISNINHHPGY